MKTMQNITNTPSLIWELGTDCLPESDLKLLDNPELVSYTKPEAAIINVYSFKYQVEQGLNQFSPTLTAIIEQAENKGFQWVMFDMDLETDVHFEEVKP